MRCARGERVLAFALGTLLVCGVVNAVVAAVEQMWWTWGVSGACLAAALAVARRWQRPPVRRRPPRAAAMNWQALVWLDHDDVDAAA